MFSSLNQFIHCVTYLFIHAYIHAACSRALVRIMRLQLHVLVNVSHAAITSRFPSFCPPPRALSNCKGLVMQHYVVVHAYMATLLLLALSSGTSSQLLQ